jgi:adenylate kinase
MIIILLGPPGSGKGTQAEKIAVKFSLAHISMGDILRKAVADKTPVGLEAEKYLAAGKLVPDQITVQIAAERIKQNDCKNGFLLDGFPRTLEQGQALDEMLKKEQLDLNKVLYISVPLELVVERLTGRLSCRACGKIYHKKYNPPSGNNCDCGGELYTRPDDNEEVIKTRFSVYEKQTKPLVDYYAGKNKLVKIDGSKNPEEVYRQVVAFLS